MKQSVKYTNDFPYPIGSLSLLEHFLSCKPLVHPSHKSVRNAKISFLKLEGIEEKFPMRAASMSRQTIGVYLRLSLRNRWKEELRH